MFEKEAEEYANGRGHEHYNYLFEKTQELLPLLLIGVSKTVQSSAITRLMNGTK